MNPTGMDLSDDNFGLSHRPRKDVAVVDVKRRIKIVSCGDAASGKSCLIKRLCEKRFIAKYLATIGIDFGVTTYKVSGQPIKVNFFDMSGHASFKDVRSEFYQDTGGIILAFDVTSRHSFTNLEQWVTELRSSIPNLLEAVSVSVCANKIDKPGRVITEGQAKLWAESKGFHYHETSAQSGDGIEEMFARLFTSVFAAQKNQGVVDVPDKPLFGQVQLDEITRMLKCKNNYERLKLEPTCAKEDVNKAYKRLAALLHPDKNRAPGSDDAFKALVAARTAVLQGLQNSRR